MAKKQPAANGHATPVAETEVDSTALPTDKSEFLKLFWTLAESDVATRTRAASHLLAYLQDHPDDVQYTLKRLVRGLASSRDAARQGFSAALAALVAEFPQLITLRGTLQLLNEAMQVTVSMKAMEQREHMFGKLFGLLALHRSGRLSGKSDLEEKEDVTVAIVKELVDMSKWKKWLREACIEAILTVLSDVPKELFVREVASVVAVLLEGDVTAFNADQVALAVGVHHYIHTHKLSADVLPADYPALHFVRRKHMHALVEPLKHSTMCFPRVHGAWVGLFGHIMHVGSDGAKLDSELFQEAWNVLVENMLLTPATTTHERKGLALKLFELVVPSLPSAVVRAILTPHLVKCLFNNTLSKKTYLHDAARHTLHVFATQAPAEYFHFFQREFTKPMHSLVENAAAGDDDQEELKEAVKSGGFDAIIAIEEERERQAILLRKYASVRLWALEHMASALVDLTSPEQQQLRDRVLQFLTRHAFFAPPTHKTITPTKKNKKAAKVVEVVAAPEPALSLQVRAALVKKLFSLLSVQLSSAEDATLATVFTSVLSLVESGAQELRVPLDDAQKELLHSVQGHVTSLRQKKETEKEATDDAFLLLFMSCGLQLVDAAQRRDAQGVVMDLEKCFVDIQKQKSKTTKNKKSPSKKSTSSEEERSSVDAVVVLTDLLLSLLSQDSSAMREIVTHVFKDLVPLMNAQSLRTLVAAVAPVAPGDEDEEEEDKADDGDQEMEEEDGEEEEEEEEEVVLSSATDIADALRSDANLAELHREDQTLSAIVGQVRDKANAKKDAKRHRLHVLHFKLRVVDLLALYATASAKTSPDAVRLVLPLFESLTAIASSDVEQRVLKERLQSVLLHKFIKALAAKEDMAVAVASADERDGLVAALERVVELLSKKPLDKELVNKVGAAVVVQLVRAVPPSPELEAVVRAAAVDVFTKKHSKFPRVVFDELITKHSKLAVHLLLPTLTEIATASASSEAGAGSLAAVDDFSKSEVFRVLSLLLKPKHLSDASERKVFDANRQALLRALVTLLEQKKKEPTTDDADDKKKSDMKSKRVKVYLSFALHLVRTWAAEGHNATKTKKEVAALVEVVESLETSSPVVKNMVKQLLQAATGEEPAKEEAPTPTKTNKVTPTKKSPTPTPTRKSPTPTKKKPTPTKKTPTPTKRKRSSSMADDE